MLGKSLAELDAIPVSELLGWQALYQFEPWGCPADDSRTEALLRMTFAINSKRGTKIPERFIDRDPEVAVKRKPKPTRKQLEENIREAFAGIKITRVVEGQPESAPDK